MKNICLFLLVIFGLSGCFYIAGDPAMTPILKVDLPDIHLFENDNCLSGCWRDLRPGATTRDEFEKFFMALNFGSIQTGNSSDYSWYKQGASNSKDQYYLEGFTKKNTLTKISLTGPFDLTLGKVIEKLGNPKQIIIYPVRAGVDVTDTLFHVYWLYPNYGYIFGTTYDSTNSDYCATQADIINKFIVLQAGTLETLITNWITPQDSTVLPDIENNVRKTWTEFGCVSTN